MLIDQEETRETVRRIVFKVTPHPALHDDLTQEAIIHLWLREQECPGQTESWYYQSCRFFLHNLLRSGRSVDAIKRGNSLSSLEDAGRYADRSVEESASGESVRTVVSAHEAMDLLTKWLTPTECYVLGLLEQGYSVRGIADQLDISHTSVIRHRKKIATLASKLGIIPLP